MYLFFWGKNDNFDLQTGSNASMMYTPKFKSWHYRHLKNCLIDLLFFVFQRSEQQLWLLTRVCIKTGSSSQWTSTDRSRGHLSDLGGVITLYGWGWKITSANVPRLRLVWVILLRVTFQNTGMDGDYEWIERVLSYHGKQDFWKKSANLCVVNGRRNAANGTDNIKIIAGNKSLYINYSFR